MCRFSIAVEKDWTEHSRIERAIYTTVDLSGAAPRRLDFFSSSVQTQIFASGQLADSPVLAVKYADGLVIYDSDTLEVIRAMEGPPPEGPIAFVKKTFFFGDNTNLKCLIDGNTQIWHDLGSRVLQLCPVQGNRLLTLTEDGRALVWDVDSKKLLSDPTEEGCRAEAVSVSHDERFVALKYSSDYIDLVDLETRSSTRIQSPEVWYGGAFNSSFGLFSDGEQVRLVCSTDRGMNGIRHGLYTAWPSDEPLVEEDAWGRGRGFVFQSAASFEGLPLLARVLHDSPGHFTAELATLRNGQWTASDVCSFSERPQQAILITRKDGPLLIVAFADRLELFRPDLKWDLSGDDDAFSSSLPSGRSETQPTNPPSSSHSSAGSDSSRSIPDEATEPLEMKTRSTSKTPFPWLLVSSIALTALLGSALLLRRYVR